MSAGEYYPNPEYPLYAKGGHCLSAECMCKPKVESFDPNRRKYPSATVGPRIPVTNALRNR
jgi:hypothetical protein